jgi:hypothetical protein
VDLGEGNEYFSQKYFFHTLYSSFMCCKILQHGASSFTFPLKEGELQFFITLKNPSPQPGLNPQSLGTMASTLTITLPMRPYLSISSGLVILNIV